MTKVLYVTAHPLDHSVSSSLAVGKEFLEAYKNSNPDDEIILLDLYNMDIPYIDADVFSGWGKLASGSAFDQLSPESQAKVSRLGEIVDQFVSADKVVVVNPVWNFLFPPILKAYIDAICVAGKTFKFNEAGVLVGLAADKKLLHIQASGSVLSEGPFQGFEFSHRYLTAIAQFIGIQSIEVVYVEGAGASPDKGAEIKEKAMQKARELGKSF
ncbi:FMN-dependent NADH-azoreductase [Paenibacillus psychroresistens]|uniref:FMN dependent NADH:quinone oxidoreductase n=1 Tax=Paenibacillus psychroresistens TaxID=1778678 RepID=A0A6B8RT56_9BACL|nr:NAD(P)H-dependent oxidoreductase [Paenibacillus psychroresistens]QGQ98765.1 FMN-dependent NADH-azoreductase [Paenibacillus psychroresistens]